MRICELCGDEQELETQQNEAETTRMLHICEKCQEDQLVNYFDI